jgi:endo-1,4-beta-D-glucanase Y
MRILTITIVALVALVAVGCGGGEQATAPSPAKRADAAATRFLDTYVAQNGRVVRRDQGNDTVSEGQAYAMLVAAATGDRARFERVWSWTKSNLQRPDGLLSYRWDKGRVADPEPATDADLDAARALLLGAERFGRPAYRAEALRLADSILQVETTTVHGRRVLVAGPWGRSPVTVNPSYFAPRAYQALAAATRDPRWTQIARSSRRLLTRLTTPDRLPSDWARVNAKGRVRATGPPSELSQMPKYGFDAIRVPARLAESCEPQDRALAARMWPVLQKAGAGRVVELTVDGDPVSAARNGASLASAAAAADAAGDDSGAESLLEQAEAQDRRQPTYYGAAWIAMTRLGLDGDRLGGCD